MLARTIRNALFFTLLATAAQAQFVENGETVRTPSDGANPLLGQWEGYLICGGRGWAIFHTISDVDGQLKSAMQSFQSKRREREADIFLSGDRVVIDVRDSEAYDYEYTLSENRMTGVGRGVDCTTKLWRVSASN